MSKVIEAGEILRKLGLPRQQQNQRSCLTLLALAALQESQSWEQVRRPLLRTVDIMEWMSTYYGKSYKPNSRETIRRQTLHQFEQARLIDRNPDAPQRPTNSGLTSYQLTAEASAVLAAYGKRSFGKQCREFLSRHGALSAAYAHSRGMLRVPVKLSDGTELSLSPGEHNQLQRAIIEEFASRFAPGAVVIYIGDTANKRLHVNREFLVELKIPEMSHDKLPDVVLYDPSRNWLFLIEAMTSHGPVSPKRHAELELMLERCGAERIYVTAFLNFTAFKKHASEIVWESEVWISEAPDHMIHFNGDRFLGPRTNQRADESP